MAFRHFTTKSYRSVSRKQRRTHLIMQVDEQTTWDKNQKLHNHKFFVFFLRTIRITTNMVGPHNLFFVFLLKGLLFYFFSNLSGYHPSARLWFEFWRRSGPFLFFFFSCKHKNTTDVLVQFVLIFQIVQGDSVLVSALALSPQTPTETCSLNVPGPPRFKGVAPHMAWLV